MAVVLKPKRGTNTPGTDDIVSGEIAIDTSAKKLYINDGGTVKEIGGGGAGGSTTEVTQSSHGFSAKDCIRHNGSSWVKAQANVATTLALGVVTALFHREKSGHGQRVTCSMQDGVLNLCRVKLRDQQRLKHGPLKEYPQYPNGVFGDATPRSGNASGWGQPGWIVKCKGWETDPDAYIYVITQAAAFPELAKVIGHADWLEDPDWSTPEARLPKLDKVFEEIEKWTMTKTKYEVMDILNPLNVPCGPIISMKELSEESSLKATGTIVEVDHPERGKYLTVGNPIKLSDSKSEVKRSPLLGEHTDEILAEIGLSDQEILTAKEEKAV